MFKQLVVSLQISGLLTVVWFSQTCCNVMKPTGVVQLDEKNCIKLVYLQHGHKCRVHHTCFFASCSYMVFASYRSLLDVVGPSSVKELENIIPKVSGKNISKNVSLCLSSYALSSSTPGGWLYEGWIALSTG